MVDETKPKTRTVYDEAGKAYLVDPVDAKEYIATGRYTAEHPKPVVAEVKHEVKEPAKTEHAQETKKA